MSEYKSEVEIITAVIDLATSRRQPINAYGDFDEWLTFESVCTALEDICKELKIGKHVEQNCYQALLRMSAESERHLTWWEKVGQIDRYLRPGPRSGVKNKSTASNSTLSRLPAPSPHLIRLVEPERGRTVERRTVNMDQSNILENEQLSMLLNGTSGMFQSSQNYGYRSDRISPSRSTHRGEGGANSTSRSIFTSNSMHGQDTTRRRIHFNDQTTERHYKSWQAVNDKLSDIQRESHQVKEDIAQHILNRSGATALGTTMASVVGSGDGPHTTPASKAGHIGAVAGDWMLSPSVIHPDSSAVNLDTPFAKAAAPVEPTADHAAIPPPVPTNLSYPSEKADPASPKRTKSRAYSELLRQSSVMSKYLGISMVGGQTVHRSRSRSESPPRSAAKASPSETRSVSVSAFSRPHASLSPPVSSPSPRAPPGRKHSPLFDSPPPPTPAPRHHHHHLQSDETSRYRRRHSPSDSLDAPPPRTPSARPGMAPFAPYTPARVVPLVLQGQHGAGGVYTPEGHINVDALDFDPATLPQEAFLSAAVGGEGDPAASEQLVSAITSATRVLILFHRWLLQRSDPKSHADEARNASLVLAAHFSEVGEFVSSLFGLEQWLRSKMRLIVLTEAKAHVFRTWNLQYGVSAQSRMFWRRRRLHQGFEAFLEYGLKRRMHRKNALHALAARRRHVNVSHMTPILRHRPARLNASFAEDGDVEGDDGTSELNLNQSGQSLKDLDRLNKYSRIDLTMLQDPDRRSAAKRAAYHTSLSIRDILHDVRAALLVYSRGGTNSDALRVKTYEYEQAQDTVALLFAFRRLYHRSIYISRQRRVRARVRRSRIAAAMSLWKQSWLARSSVEKALEPRLMRILERMEEVKLRLAVRRLHWHVSVSRREKALLHRYAHRIRSKPLYLRALHSMRCAAYVKCFLALKRHYVSHSPSVAEQRRSDGHHADYQQRHALRRWRRWCEQRSQSRRSGIRGEASRRALMGLLLHRAQLWHLVQPGRHSAETHMSPDSFLALPAVQQMHMSRGLIRRCVQQLQLRRALARLRTVGRCTRVFFSLTELRFAQALCRRSQPSERRKYLRLLNGSSCRILPATRQASLTVQTQTREALFRRPGTPVSQGATARSTAEKPYRLIGLHPTTLQYYIRTVYTSTSAEEQSPLIGHAHRAGRTQLVAVAGEDSIRRSAEFLAPFLQRSIVTTDGGALCNTPQLLRHLRKWILLCKEKHHLRRLAEKVKRRRGVAVLRETYERWAQAYQWERECNRSTKSRVFRKLRASVARARIVNSANRRTRQGVAHRHWQRFVAAHVHQTELRRLHGGHFYNSVMSGASRKVLAFIVNHDSVPFSVRHFLSNFPSYRFPIYKRYEASYWEHSTHSAAYKALLVLCQHYQVYGHEHDLHHHLEIFQHHHEEAFSPGRGEFVRSSGAPQDATPAAKRGRSESPARPLHLLPGAMLSDQAFSVRAAISSRYQRGTADASTSPQMGRASRSRTREEPRTPGAGGWSTLSIKTSGAGTDVACEPPAAVQLAGASVFMAHWISECLGQYYALRRGFVFLRKHAQRRARRAGLVWQVFLAKKQTAFAALWRNRCDHVLTKTLQLRRTRAVFRKMRVCAVNNRSQRGQMRRTLHHMCVVYRYRIILRTWQSAWRSRVQSAWDKLRQFTTQRDRVVTRLMETLHRRILRDTIRTMCTVTTANLWRRRRHRVAGLRAFVMHYNRSVQAMDREELVRTYATTKHYTTLRENALSLLKQRLCNVVGMAYCKKLALIRGFLSIAGNVREPQRRVSEAVLRDRMYHSLFVLRRNHAAYRDHPFRTYNFEEEQGLVINTFNSFRERQLLKTSSRYQQEYSTRGVHHPYVSDTLPLPSPVPPAHTLDTPLRRASMLRSPESPARITHDTLSEAPPVDEALMSPGSRARLLVKSPSATPSSFYPRSPARDGHQRSGTLPFSPSTERLFGAVRDSNSTAASHHQHMASSARNSAAHRSSLNTRSMANSTAGASVAKAGEDSTGRSSTLTAMAQRRRSTHQLRQQLQQEQDLQGSINSPSGPSGQSSMWSAQHRNRADENDSDSLNSDDVELVATPSFRLQPRTGRSSLATPRSAASPDLPGGRRASTGTPTSAASTTHSRESFSGLSRRASTAAGSSQDFRQGSVGNSVVSRSTRLSRRSSLHDVHDDMLSAPTSAAPTVEQAPTPFSEVTMQSAQSIPRGPSSILITSPAYNPAPRSTTRRDSRIFFHDSVNEGCSSGGGVGGASGPASAGSTGSFLGSRRGSDNRLRTNSSDAPPAESLQPFSPLAQRLGEENPRTVGSFFLDDNSEVSTLRDGDSMRGGGAGGGYQRLPRRKSSIHLQRTEETAEQMQVLMLAMQRGLWKKWRRELVFRKQMRQFCTRYLCRRLLRTGLLTLRRQTAIDRFQRLQLRYIDKRRAFSQLQTHAAQQDERRQVADFADKYYVIMAVKLALRRWRSRAKKAAVSTGRFRRAAAFSSKRLCTLLLLSLRASCVALPGTAPEVAVAASPERQARHLRRGPSSGSGKSSRGPSARMIGAVKAAPPTARRKISWDEREDEDDPDTPITDRTRHSGSSNSSSRRAAATLTPGAISSLLR